MLWRSSIVALPLALVMSGSARAQTSLGKIEPPATLSADSLATFLRAWIPSQRSHYELLQDTADFTTWYSAGYVSTGSRGDSALFLVYLVGRAWCAGDAAGCHTIVILRAKGVYRVVGDIGHTHLPLGALPATCRAFPDLTAWIAGGGSGLDKPHRARLHYEGESYPDEPWEAPATHEVGRIIVSGTPRWQLLYPQPTRQGSRTSSPNDRRS